MHNSLLLQCPSSFLMFASLGSSFSVVVSSFLVSFLSLLPLFLFLVTPFLAYHGSALLFSFALPFISLRFPLLLFFPLISCLFLVSSPLVLEREKDKEASRSIKKQTNQDMSSFHERACSEKQGAGPHVRRKKTKKGEKEGTKKKKGGKERRVRRGRKKRKKERREVSEQMEEVRRRTLPSTAQ